MTYIADPLLQQQCLADVAADAQSDANTQEQAAYAQADSAAAALTDPLTGAVAATMLGGLGAAAVQPSPDLELSVPTSEDEARDQAIQVARLLWDQLPLPPPWDLTLRSDIDVPSPVDGRPPRPELVAPIVGYGLSTASASRLEQDGMSGCMSAGYPRFTPSRPNIRGSSLFRFDGSDGLSGSTTPIEYQRLWQPYPFNRLNWIVDVDPDSVDDLIGNAPAGCRASFIGSNMVVPTRPECSEFLSRLNPLPFGFDDERSTCSSDEPNRDVTGPDPFTAVHPLLFALEAVGFTLQCSAVCSGELTAERVIDESRGLLWLHDKAFVVVDDALASRLVHYHSVGEYPLWNPCACHSPRSRIDTRPRDRLIRWWDSQPRVWAADAAGQPLTNRDCEVQAKADSESNGGLTRLRVEGECREDAIVPGLYRIDTLRVAGGGSNGRLEVDVRVDGVPVVASSESWWAFDSTISYLSGEMIDPSRLNVLFLIGHGSFSLFALISVPMFMLNLPESGRERLFDSLIATLFLLLLMVYQGSVVRSIYWHTDPAASAEMYARGQTQNVRQLRGI